MAGYAQNPYSSTHTHSQDAIICDLEPGHRGVSIKIPCHRTTSAVQMLRLCYWQSHRAATGVDPHPTSQFLSTSSSTHRLENRIRSQPSTCHAWSYLIKIEWLSLHRRENFLFVFGYWYEQPANRYGRTHSFFRTWRLLKSMQGNERKRWIDYAMAKFWEKCKRLDKLFVRFK